MLTHGLVDVVSAAFGVQLEWIGVLIINELGDARSRHPSPRQR